MISIKKYAEMQNDPIFLRKSYSYGVEDTVREILDGVKQKGDAALFAFTRSTTTPSSRRCRFRNRRSRRPAPRSIPA